MTDKSSTGSVSRDLAASVLRNAKVFLRKAAEEIAGHADGQDRPFDVDRAVIVTVLIQTAVELATAALVLRHDGVPAILAKDDGLTDAQIRAAWLSGGLRTQTFGQLKQRASQLFHDEDYWALADGFQMLRNKLVHLHHPIEHDAYDLKFDTTWMLVKTLSGLLGQDETEYPATAMDVLGPELLRALTRFPPYLDRGHRLAAEHDRPLVCPDCDCNAYVECLELCFGCGANLPADLLTCPFCHRRPVWYDSLNLEDNGILKALCGACGEQPWAAECPKCHNAYAFLPGNQYCPCCDV